MTSMVWFVLLGLMVMGRDEVMASCAGRLSVMIQEEWDSGVVLQMKVLESGGNPLPAGTRIEMDMGEEQCLCDQIWNAKFITGGRNFTIETNFDGYGFGFVCRKNQTRSGWESCRPTNYWIDGTDCASAEVSTKSCEDLGWHRARNFGSFEVCASSTEADGTCPVPLAYSDAAKFCAKQGARVCTAYELQSDEARQSGCNLEAKRVWTSSPCASSAHLTAAGGKDEKNLIVWRCSSNLAKYPVRCCADFENVIRTQGRNQTIPNSPLTQGLSLLIDCGGYGTHFISDESYLQTWSTSDFSVATGTGGLDEVYSSWRMGNPHLIYEFPLSAGSYNITLMFAELSAEHAIVGARVFDTGIKNISAGWSGAVGVAGLDVFSRAQGLFRPYALTFENLTTNDGFTIGFFHKGHGMPIVNGINIESTSMDKTLVTQLMLNAKALAVRQIRVNVDEKFQTLEGFGAAVAWYGDWVLQHPSKNAILDLAFNETQLSLLRLRNDFDRADNRGTIGLDGYRIYREAQSRIMEGFKVLLTSWTPPAVLKANGQLRGNGQGNTLARFDGQYVYDDFGLYWKRSLQEFRKYGINPTWISIQNEPDFDPAWEGCHFGPEEDDIYAGYGKALDSVYRQLASLANPPGIIGPETTGIGARRCQQYLNSLNLSQLVGIAHHLYGTQFGGGDFSNPLSFEPFLATLAEEAQTTYGNLPLFQTEFARLAGRDYEDPINLAWIIHLSLTVEQASAYFHWDSFWGSDEATMIRLEQPNDPSLWTTPDGFEVHQSFYAFKHYSRFIRPGWRRVGVQVTDGSLLVSAYQGIEKTEHTVVVINVGFDSKRISVTGVDQAGVGKVYLTTRDKSQCSLVASNYTSGTILDAPERSIITIAFS